MNGDYQDGVLTSYCAVDDVAHVELNGHILIPLQNVASLHCSSRCDAPEPDWPPRGVAGPAIRNILKAWALLVGLCALLGALGWWIGGLRVALVFGFGGALVGVGSYIYSDRIVLGMVGGRETVPGRGAPGR